MAVVQGVLNDYRRSIGASAVLAGLITAVVNYAQGDLVFATTLLLAAAGLAGLLIWWTRPNRRLSRRWWMSRWRPPARCLLSGRCRTNTKSLDKEGTTTGHEGPRGENRAWKVSD
jgi:hypothetical protein